MFSAEIGLPVTYYTNIQKIQVRERCAWMLLLKKKCKYFHVMQNKLIPTTKFSNFQV